MDLSGPKCYIDMPQMKSKNNKYYTSTFRYYTDL